MCSIEEKIYTGPDGQSRTFQDTVDYDRAAMMKRRKFTAVMTVGGHTQGLTTYYDTRATIHMKYYSAIGQTAENHSTD